MSKPLRALVNNDMKESKEGRAEWDEVDEETFVRFCQFAYTGSYDDPIPKVLPEVKDEPREKAPEPSYSSEEVVPAPTPAVDPAIYGVYVGIMGQGQSKKHKKSIGFTSPGVRNSNRIWDQFEMLSYKVPESPNKDSKPPPVPYSEVFLSHARLYVLADCYDIQNLRTLSLQKLHRILVDIKLGTAQVADFVKLAEYSYQNTVHQCGRDELQTLLAKYMACRIEVFWSSTAFRELLAEYGEISAAVIGHMIPRL
ncbi:hypothetical protein F4775DRAFT_560329, partial [Biscogniauxia sp. FL1348]